MLKLLLLVGACSAIKYIIQFKETFVYNIQSFYEDEYPNIEYSYSILGLNGVIYEYPVYPYHLEEYEFVEYIEEDVVMSIDSKRHTFSMNTAPSYFLQTNPIWNLDRNDQVTNDLNGKYYFYSTGGKSANVFVVDTGIEITHPEFGGRATWGVNTIDNTNTDCNGHGTHVAGSVGSKTYGVAKMTNLIAVKVLDCKGSGTNSGVIKGLEYVANAKLKNSIVNMSLGGPKSDILNSVLAKMVASGIHVVAAAGNENQDACNTSPASEQSVLTVGAFSRSFVQSQFSNWGSCVDVLAPGEQIVSTYLSGTTKALAGTSMATPQVAGMLALSLGEKEMTPKDLNQLMRSKCNKINSVKNGTPNCVAYSLSLV